ncbi:unnamed protein product [Lactuca virosa]|uniref:tRNA pseudouridine synthase n=1 Tax=Lactuca virosa TaxID=75947 RepID=A0AAU9NRF6_9ASTR|nr:unnamed protein product [Lactuca virosa]
MKEEIGKHLQCLTDSKKEKDENNGGGVWFGGGRPVNRGRVVEPDNYLGFLDLVAGRNRGSSCDGRQFQGVARLVTPFNYKDLHDMNATLNGLLLPDVGIREISLALPDFHARFSVTRKIYHYKIYNDTVLDLFHRLYAYHNLSELNVSVMKEAAKYFVGQHDFSSFANKQRNDHVVNPVKNISRVDIIEKGPILQVEV